MTIDSIFVALDSKVSQGAFSGERVFEVTLADGQPYIGIAPREFCWNAQGRLVEKNEPETPINGKIAARIIKRIDDGQSIVEVPDGQYIVVDNSMLRPRPSRMKINSVEQENYVLV